MYRSIIKSIMENRIGVIKKDSNLLELVSIASKSSNKILAVVNDSDKIVGVINCDNILINVIKDISKKSSKNAVINKEVSDFMNKNLIIAHPEDDILMTFDIMKNNKIDYLVIINSDNYPIGIVNIYDLFENVIKIKMRNMSFSVNEIEKKYSIEKDKVIKKLMKEIDTLHAQSTIDPLTGLFNVRYFNKIIEEEVDRAKRYKYSISIIFMDLDHFKDINDIYGHDCGNVVLHEIGKLLSNASDNNVHMLRKSDIAIRYGGEEFIVICPNTKKEQAYIVAERIRKTVEKKRFNYESTIINVTVSVGIAEHKGTSKKPIADTIKNADSAMYEAKHLGRNKVIMH
ncbi:diguanylate cyclase [Brachyspira innocens]|uniref:diguanylate cyclase n=1 Tax=Brachyspira innocens TaxID=13264 RepID=UPI00035FF102|nr:diguanylate cyclase [Brachyspira innocens]